MTKLIIAPTLVAIASLLSGCGNPDTDGAATQLQVVARVNGNEIRVRQVAGAIEQTDGSIAPRQAHPTARAVDHLIDQELLVQRALAVRLDREPLVMEAIAAERRRILGLAYLDRTVPQAPQRSAEEIERFFHANPALFERRRVYETRELAAAMPDDTKSMLKIQIAHGAQIDDVIYWLRSQGVRFEDTASTRPAEDIPLELLPRLAEMGDAQIALFASADRVSVVQLIHARNAPLSESQAAPVIERMLNNRWRLELAMTEVKQLREAAKIEYLGPFAGKRPAKEPSGASGKLRPTATDEDSIRRGAGLL